MVLSSRTSTTEGYRRREVLAGLASGTGVLLGAGTSSAIEGEVPRTVYIPTVSGFENEYEGQFLTIAGPLESDGSPQSIHDACGEVPWEAAATTSKVGQLSDRRSDTPQAVRLPIYVNDAQANLVEDALFVVSDATPCDGGFVRLDVEWVTTRSLVGKPAGPIASSDDASAGEDGPGFGLAAGALGVAGAALAWLRRADGDA